MGDDGTEIEEWDFGAWHQPTMGIGLLAENGTQYSAVWGRGFGDYGLEIFREPMVGLLVVIGQPGGPAAVAVTGHPSWSGLIGVPLVGAEIHWAEDDSEIRVPVAVELRAPAATAWLVSGRPAQWPPDGRFHLGTDDVMTAFTNEAVTAMGLSREGAEDWLRPGAPVVRHGEGGAGPSARE
ncbi:hypothetical protein ACQEVS_26440 [Streptomyces sp. CA-181903]|uniref:hypothetical protein n=1 Tax=Streptomyces sp. CA-181903 TaxID=3240055 RepID=UPI003D8F90C8